MKTENKRLLEAFEYLDAKYIDELFDALGTPPRRNASRSGKRTYWYIPVLAACLLLLSAVFPVVRYVFDHFDINFPGWGNVQEEVPYLQFSPDLEPISKELAEEINEAYILFYLGMTKDELLLQYEEKAPDKSPEEKYDRAWRVIRNYDFRSPYYGKFGECIIFATFSDGAGFPDGWWTVNVAGHEFTKFTYVYVNKEVYHLDVAYEMKLLTDEDIELLSKRHDEFVQFKSENRDMFPQ